MEVLYPLPFAVRLRRALARGRRKRRVPGERLGKGGGERREGGKESRDPTAENQERQRGWGRKVGGERKEEGVGK